MNELKCLNHITLDLSFSLFLLFSFSFFPFLSSNFAADEDADRMFPMPKRRLFPTVSIMAGSEELAFPAIKDAVFSSKLTAFS